MKYLVILDKFNESIETECQTPGSVYNIDIRDNSVSIKVDLPMELTLSAEDAVTLEANLHNAVELVLNKYFNKSDTGE